MGDIYLAPVAGKTGFRCEQAAPATEGGEKGARPTGHCADTKDADDKVTNRGCCSAVIPYNADPNALKWALTTPGRMEVCLVSSGAVAATTWEPVQFVPILETKYSAMCIEGAMKAAAGAAAIM